MSSSRKQASIDVTVKSIFYIGNQLYKNVSFKKFLSDFTKLSFFNYEVLYRMSHTHLTQDSQFRLKCFDNTSADKCTMFLYPTGGEISE